MSHRAPLAGRPPFATDDDDESVYEQPAPTPRRRPQQNPNPNNNPARQSQYQAWDSYLQDDQNRNSGVGGIGMGLMNGNMDDDSDDDDNMRRRPAPHSTNHVNSATEKNQASFVHALSPPGATSALARPAPVATARSASFDRQSPVPPAYQPSQQQRQQDIPQARPRQAPGQRAAAADLRVEVRNPAPGMTAPQAAMMQPAMPIPRAPAPAFMQGPPPSPSPSLNPHPLNAPSTPITPVFARPSFQESRDVKFKASPILRGDSEETLIPRGTVKGEEFWRRFSVVAKEQPKKKTSSWLVSTQGGTRRMSRWVWCISVTILLAIGGGIGIGWYYTHDAPPSLPVAIGGSEERTAGDTEIATETPTLPSPTIRSVSAPPAIETKRSLPLDMELAVRVANDPLSDTPVKRTHLDAHRRALHRSRMVIEDLD